MCLVCVAQMHVGNAQLAQCKEYTNWLAEDQDKMMASHDEDEDEQAAHELARLLLNFLQGSTDSRSDRRPHPGARISTRQWPHAFDMHCSLQQQTFASTSAVVPACTYSTDRDTCSVVKKAQESAQAPQRAPCCMPTVAGQVTAAGRVCTPADKAGCSTAGHVQGAASALQAPALIASEAVASGFKTHLRLNVVQHLALRLDQHRHVLQGVE